MRAATFVLGATVAGALVACAPPAIHAASRENVKQQTQWILVLQPSHHQALRGSGPTNCALGDTSTTVQSCHNDLELNHRLLASWVKARKDGARPMNKASYLQMRIFYEKQIADDYGVLSVIDKPGALRAGAMQRPVLSPKAPADVAAPHIPQ